MALKLEISPLTGWLTEVQDLGGYVPYTGATASVVLGTNTLSAAQLIALSDKTGYSASQANTHLSLRGSTTSTKELVLSLDTTNDDAIIQARNFGIDYMDLCLQPSGGKVGIGTTAPDEALDVVGNIDFNKYKAIAMCCDSGATMPTTPNEGQWFLQVATGRKVLYIYENATWNPMYGFGDLTYYVDGASGTDSLDKGTGTGADAFDTIQYAINAIPATTTGSIVVNVAAGTYNEEVSIGGKELADPTDTITIQGPDLDSITPDISATCDSFTRGYYGNTPNYATPAQLTDTGAFTAAAQECKWCYIGATAGWRLIYKNTADVLYLVDGTTTAATTYKVTSLAATITNSGTATRNVVNIRSGQTGVYVKYFNLTSTGSGQVIRGEYGSEYYFYYCKISPGSGTQNITTQYAIASYYYCSLYQTNGVATIGVNLGSVLRMWGCLLRWTSTSGYGIRNIGAFINMAELTTFYGPSTAIEKPGIVLNNGGFCTLFQNYFDVGYGVVCDGVSWCGIQSEYYAGWSAAVTTDIYKPLDARNAEIRILTALAVEKETMGYDISGDYLYDELLEVKRIGTPATNYSQFDTTGHLTMEGTAKPWRDELADALSLQTTGAGISKNATEATVDYTTSTKLNEYAYCNVQLNHDKEIGGAVYPHIHFFQEQNVMPNWLLQYRWQPNGSTKVTTWTDRKCIQSAFTYTTGTIHQIAYASSITAPASSTISDILQFRIIRDTGNSSTTFTGSDANSSTAAMLGFDVHFQINSLGSTDEYVK